MNVSLNPSFLCNFRCSFCYLTRKQLSDPKVIPLPILRERLQEIVAAQGGQPITHLDLYGGEVGLLEETYFYQLLDLLEEFVELPINVISNFSVVPDYFLDERISLSVSFDFEARQSSQLVLTNISMHPKNIAILVLASKKVIETDVEHQIQVLNQLRNVTSVEIKPFSENQNRRQSGHFEEFETFVSKWMDSPTKKNFTFVNELKIEDSLNGTYNAFSDDHIYILPSGKFGILEFDHEDREFFQELEGFSDFVVWNQQEKRRVEDNSYCQKCKYKGHCLTEHYRVVQNVERSCNGFYKLLDRYSGRFATSSRERTDSPTL
jgi:MoaA/NifB/PqqE/SkfB family radical SAM enzyme